MKVVSFAYRCKAFPEVHVDIGSRDNAKSPREEHDRRASQKRESGGQPGKGISVQHFLVVDVEDHIESPPGCEVHSDFDLAHLRFGNLEIGRIPGTRISCLGWDFVSCGSSPAADQGFDGAERLTGLEACLGSSHHPCLHPGSLSAGKPILAPCHWSGACHSPLEAGRCQAWKCCTHCHHLGFWGVVVVARPSCELCTHSEWRRCCCLYHFCCKKCNMVSSSYPELSLERDWARQSINAATDSW